MLPEEQLTALIADIERENEEAKKAKEEAASSTGGSSA